MGEQLTAWFLLVIIITKTNKNKKHNIAFLKCPPPSHTHINYCFKSVKTEGTLLLNKLRKFHKAVFTFHCRVSEFNTQLRPGRYIYIWHDTVFTHTSVPLSRGIFKSQTFSLGCAKDVRCTCILKWYFSVSVGCRYFHVQAYNPCLAQSVGYAESITDLIHTGLTAPSLQLILLTDISAHLNYGFMDHLVYAWDRALRFLFSLQCSR